MVKRAQKSNRLPLLGPLLIVLVIMLLGLTGCGGGGSSDRSSTSDSNNETPNNNNETSDSNNESNGDIITGQLLLKYPDDILAATPIQGITYVRGDDNEQAKSITDNTSNTGGFDYSIGERITFTLANQSFGPITAKSEITPTDWAEALCSDNVTLNDCSYKVAQNIVNTLSSLDNNHNRDDGYDAIDNANITLDFLQPIDQFEQALPEALRSVSKTQVLSFSPSLGVNLEEPQAESNEVGGQPAAFADIFRGARPFTDYSCPDNTYDEQGWPVSIPASCEAQANVFLQGATTQVFPNAVEGSFPEGVYTVIYEGNGVIDYSGIARLVSRGNQRDEIHVTFEDRSDTDKVAGVRLNISTISASNPLRNIRIVMPGGICANDPYTHVENSSDCSDGDYSDFVERIAANRDDIIFNPDFLRELRYFKVLRTMNFTKSSPRQVCGGQDEEYLDCLLQPFEWDMRAKMDEAMWGGSGIQPLIERYGRGVPLEVIVQLANTLEKDLWFNMVHNASDDYVTEYASYVKAHLDPSLKAYVEYTNEAWNDIFWATLYVREKGTINGLGSEFNNTEYWAGALYYAQRATEIFTLWKSAYNDDSLFNKQVVRVLGTLQTDEFYSRNMLEHELNDGSQVSHYIDALATNAYFYGCRHRGQGHCSDTETVPKTLSEASSVDDVFSILHNDQDFYSIDNLLVMLKRQADMATLYGVDLVSYEAGQHLDTNWVNDEITEEEKVNLRRWMEAANRDPRMSELYNRLLEGWKDIGGQLMMMYTLPQGYHRWGSWGLKEHLNQSRDNAPKYDAVLRFMEQQQVCWWDEC